MNSNLQHSEATSNVNQTWPIVTSLLLLRIGVTKSVTSIGRIDLTLLLVPNASI